MKDLVTMKTILFALCGLLPMTLQPAAALGDESPEQEARSSLISKEWSGLREDAVIEVRESGLNPGSLEMQIRQGIFFLYNGTRDSQLTVEIDFGENAMVCYSSATPNLAFKKKGILSSTRPVGPGNFASTCFPTMGTYAFKVFGVQGRKEPLEGKVTVIPRG